MHLNRKTQFRPKGKYFMACGFCMQCRGCVCVCVCLFIARITDFHHRTKRSRLFTSNAKINNHYGFSAFFSSPVFLRRTFFPVTFCMAAIQLGSNGSKCCCGECDQIDTFSIIVQYNGFIFFQKTLNINSNHQYHRNNFNYTNFIEYERKSLRRLVFFFRLCCSFVCR